MSESVIEAVCSECQKRYRVKAALAGKRFECKGCGEVVQVPAASKKREAAVESPPNRGTTRPAKKKPASQSNDDPWDFDATEEEAAAPVIRQKKSRSEGKSQGKKKKPRRQSSEIGNYLGLILGIGGFLLFLMVYGAALAIPALRGPVSAMLAIAGTVLALVGQLGILFAAFNEDTATGFMVMFIPFYVIIFVLQSISETWKLLVCWILGLILMASSVPLQLLSEGKSVHYETKSPSSIVELAPTALGRSDS